MKLWYLGPYFRAERPQHGRYRQFAQVGVEAIGSDDPAVDAETIVLLAEILEAHQGARPAAAALEPRHAGRRGPSTRPSCRATCASTRRELSQEVRDRIDLNPLRAFDADHPGTRAGDGRTRRC